jgi:outer membrane protein TolC
MRTCALFVTMLVAIAAAGPSAAQAPRPMTLAEVVAAAVERNPAVLAASQAVRVAEANVALARAGRGPTVSASGGASQAGGTATSAGFSSSVGVSASYLVYDSHQTALAVRQAEANLRAARLALDAARQDVAQTAALAYVAVLRADRAVVQREQAVVQGRELLRLAEGQFAAGVVPRADVVRAQATLAAAEGELIAARNAADQSRAQLNAALGHPPLAPIAVAAAPSVPPVTVSAAALVELVEQRPDVRRAQADLEAAELGLALAQAGHGLRVSLVGSVSQGLSPNTNTTYSVGGTVSLPLADAGRVQAQVEAATANVAAARARLASARLAAQQQAVAALLAVGSARARITSARAGLAFAQESLRLAQGRYSAGAGAILEVVDAQTALVAAEVTLASAEFDAVAGVIALRYALGRSVADGAI